MLSAKGKQTDITIEALPEPLPGQQQCTDNRGIVSRSGCSEDIGGETKRIANMQKELA
jgi:hypothetical protein